MINLRAVYLHRLAEAMGTVMARDRVRFLVTLLYQWNLNSLRPQCGIVSLEGGKRPHGLLVVNLSVLGVAIV